MATPDFIPVGTYTTPTEIIIQAAQDEVLALLDVFLAKLPNSSTAAVGDSPDWDKISPEIETNIRAEIAAIKTAIDAAPVS